MLDIYKAGILGICNLSRYIEYEKMIHPVLFYPHLFLM